MFFLNHKNREKLTNPQGRTLLNICSIRYVIHTIQCVFSITDYPHGITILSPFSSEKKQVVSFCSQSAEELLKFVEDLRESIAEVAEMEQIRIECKCLCMLLCVHLLMFTFFRVVIVTFVKNFNIKIISVFLDVHVLSKTYPIDLH